MTDALVALVFFLLQLVLAMLPGDSELQATVYQAVLAALASLYLACRRKGAYSIDRRALVLSARVALLVVVVVVLGALAYGPGALLARLATQARPRLLAIVSTVLLAPLEEEAVFRGVLQGALRRVLGGGYAAVVQAGLFAVCHAIAGVPREVVLLTYLWGLAAAFLVEWTGSVGACVLLHGAGNAAAILGLLYALGSR